MIQQEVAHVPDPYQLETAPVRSKNVVTSQPEDGTLTDLEPSIQVPDPMALAEVADQVYETLLRKEVYHLLSPQDPRFVEVHVQVSEDNEVHEFLQDLLQIKQVLHCRWR